mmetsp:Transcript_27728/g.73197  ORF Transcript_27728/g.73197 Transcript_27728/m.73197 type:complete len:607 (-) Transcript_27728:222-2042(-)
MTDRAEEIGNPSPVDTTFERKASVLPAKYSISWSDLTFSVKKGGQTKTILNSVFGHCQPGEMMAIMGPSGCGKTSLLDLLGDRVSSGTREGTILIGNRPRITSSARAILSYVMQEDALLNCFTVRETLLYSARLSLAGWSSQQRHSKVDYVIDTMGLRDCAHTRVGDQLIKGISGGQKRRLSIAIELLQGTPILLLDEPTSGLDATAAVQVLDHLRKVADVGHAVIMSIHQASSRSYNQFHSLYLLSKGRQIYFGPVGDPALEHFESVGEVCPVHTNPAEFFLDVTNIDFGGKDEQFLITLEESYRRSALARVQRAAAHELDADPAVFQTSHRAGPFIQFWVLYRRSMHMNWKNPYIFSVRLIMYVVLAFVVGTMYFEKGKYAREDDTIVGQKAAASLLPLLFFVQAFLVFMSIAILPFFLELREVFRRERANGQITCLPFVIADFFAGLPGVALIAIISTLLVVFIADINGFGGFFLNLFLSLIVSEALMHAIGAAQPHYVIGMAFGAGLFGWFMLCEGFMVPREDIPGGWIWAHYLAFHSYSFAWFVHNQFSGDDGGPFAQDILDLYGLNSVDPVRNALIICAFALLFQICYYFVLYVFHTGRR